jgi:hypothetical protein
LVAAVTTTTTQSGLGVAPMLTTEAVIAAHSTADGDRAGS